MVGLMPTDEEAIHDGRIDKGRYYVEGVFVLEGNGWYCDSVIDKALDHNLITSEDINYQLNATVCLTIKPVLQFGFRRL